MSVQTRGKSLEDSAGLPPEEPLSPAQRRLRTVEEALTLLANLDTTTSLRGNIKFQLAVDSLAQVAMSHGLSPDQLLELMAVIGSPNPRLTQTIRCKLVKCLVPSHKVPQAAVVKVIYMITAKVLAGPTNLHSLLLRWALLVFDHLDGYDRLHRLYGLAFSFIDSVRLLPHACQLLFLLTRREDVVLFRVQKLLDLIKMLGPEPCIMGLLMIYKVYCPHLVTIRLNYGTKAFFKNHDSTWRATIEAVSSQGAKDGHHEDTGEDVRRAEKRRERAQRHRAKRQKRLVPDVHAAMQELEEEADLSDEDTDPGQTRVPYVQIDTFTSFLQNLDKIEYPSQVSAVLQDPQLQLLMTCDHDPVVMGRLSLWIQHLFAFGFKNTEEESKQNEELLEMLLHFSQNVQGLPVLEVFLSNYLTTWDGQKYAPVIFSLISCVKPSSTGFEDFSCEFLQPLLRLFFTCDVYFKVGLVTCLTDLVHNWGTAFLRTSKVKAATGPADDTPRREQSVSEREATGTGRAERESASTGRTALPGEDTRDADATTFSKELIMRLVKCLDMALVVGLRMEGDHLLLQRVAIGFIETISVLYQKYGLPLVCFPTCLFYRLLLSDCPATLASICGCINTFRMSITTVREISHQLAADHGVSYVLCDTVASYPLPDAGKASNAPRPEARSTNSLGLDAFNAVLLDVMAMLWQGRMFSQRKRLHSIMSGDFPLPKGVESLLNPRALTIYQGPAFLGLAHKFLSEAQGAESKGHPSQIEKYKEIYLRFLEREGFPQFRDLVDTNLKSRKSTSQETVDSLRV